MKILLFARLREAHGSGCLEIADGECPSEVGGLRQLLVARSEGDLAEAMSDPNTICAVNQHVATDATPVGPSDEVAFFPPMTGG